MGNALSSTLEVMSLSQFSRLKKGTGVESPEESWAKGLAVEVEAFPYSPENSIASTARYGGRSIHSSSSCSAAPRTSSSFISWLL